MKKVEVTEQVFPESAIFSPKLMSAAYSFSPQQIVLLRMYSVDSENSKKDIADRPYSLVLGVIRAIEFDESTGSPTPIAKVDILNYWRGGEASGTIRLEIVPHRYVYDDDVIGPEHIEMLSEFENKRSLFYVIKDGDSVYKCYPFLEE